MKQGVVANRSPHSVVQLTGPRTLSIRSDSTGKKSAIVWTQTCKETIGMASMAAIKVGATFSTRAGSTGLLLFAKAMWSATRPRLRSTTTVSWRAFRATKKKKKRKEKKKKRRREEDDQ